MFARAGPSVCTQCAESHGLRIRFSVRSHKANLEDDSELLSGLSSPCSCSREGHTSVLLHLIYRHNRFRSRSRHHHTSLSNAQFGTDLYVKMLVTKVRTRQKCVYSLHSPSSSPSRGQEISVLKKSCILYLPEFPQSGECETVLFTCHWHDASSGKKEIATTRPDLGC